MAEKGQELSKWQEAKVTRTEMRVRRMITMMCAGDRTGDGQDCVQEAAALGDPLHPAPGTVLYFSVLFCTILYCTALYYTVLYYAAPDRGLHHVLPQLRQLQTHLPLHQVQTCNRCLTTFSGYLLLQLHLDNFINIQRTLKLQRFSGRRYLLNMGINKLSPKFWTLFHKLSQSHG